MATITGSFSNNNLNVGIYIDYTYTQNIANNTSTITAKLYVSRKRSYATTNKNNTPCEIKIGGASVYSKTQSVNVGALSVGSSLLIGTASKTITHNSDGTASVNIYGKVDLSGTNPGTGTVNSTITLPTIPRKTNVSLSGGANFGSVLTINHTGASTAFRHNVKYYLGSTSGTIVSGASGNSTSWTIPKSLQSQIPNSKTVSLKIVLETVSGGSVIGTSEASKTVTIASDCVPSVPTAVFSDAVSKPSGVNGYYQNYSKVKSVISASGTYGSTIKSYKVTYNSKDFTSTGNTITTGVVANAGANDIRIEVTDSRGMTAYKHYTGGISVTAYSAPWISNLSYKRTAISDGVEQPSNMGTIGYFSASGSFHAASTSQSRAFKYRTKSGSTWTNVSISNQNYTDFKFATNLSTADAYILRFEMKDMLQTVVKEIEMANIYPLISMNPNGTGIAFGKEASTDYLMDINMNIKLSSDKKITKNAQSAMWREGAVGKGALIHIPNHPAGANVPIKVQKTDYGSWQEGVYRNDILSWAFMKDSDIAAGSDAVYAKYNLSAYTEGEYWILGTNASNVLNYSYMEINTNTNNGAGGLGVKTSDGTKTNITGTTSAGLVTSNKELRLGAFGRTNDLLFTNEYIDSQKFFYSKGNIGTNLLTYYSNGGWNNTWGVGIESHLLPSQTNRYCGTSSYRWQGMYSVTALNVSSDAKMKEGIVYVSDEPHINSYSNTGEETLTTKDFLDFIKDDLRVALFDYKIDELSLPEEGMLERAYKLRNRQVGFIAQDIVDTRVGKYIITKGDDDILGYETGNYSTVIAGALQEEIKIREKDISDMRNEIASLKSEIEILKDNKSV